MAARLSVTGSGQAVDDRARRLIHIVYSHWERNFVVGVHKPHGLLNLALLILMANGMTKKP